MFFYEKIKSIKAGDRVLEVGPGGNPHPRSDVLLEKVFDEKEAAEQRGHAPQLSTSKETIFYSGSKFPFQDKQFDYVICAHVLEHVPADEIEDFLAELQRVASKGYIEYPTIYYEYLYNFKVHKTLLHRENGVINYVGKDELPLAHFFPLQRFFYETLADGMSQIVDNYKAVFFQGFEWAGNELSASRNTDINSYVLKEKIFPVPPERARRSLVRRLISRFKR